MAEQGQGASTTRKQENRSFAVQTPLGDDVLLLRSMSVREQMGRPFEITLDLLSEKNDIAFEDLLGQNMTVRAESPGAETRYFNGYVASFVQAGEVSVQRTDLADTSAKSTLTLYRATLVPWIWLLSRTSDCRIFQQMNVPDIIKQVFRDFGFSDFEESLNGTYEPIEFTVQYRETALAFVTRLMEREGIYFHFRHENGKHTAILSDNPSAHQPVDGAAEIPFYPEDEQTHEGETISVWKVVKTVQPAMFALREFDFKNPKNLTDSKSNHDHGHAVGTFEVYDYEGSWAHLGQGDRYVTIRREEVHAGYELIEAECDVTHLRPGATFTLTDPSNFLREDQRREYLVIEMTVEAAVDTYGATSGGDDEYRPYTCRFKAIPQEIPFRLARTTPCPVIDGPQTAIVVGQSGEEITTDEHGRVKLQFHWDRDGKADETASCWVRVSHAVAGKSWGGIFLPRHGQEVIVEFLEGNPDRPIVTGRVYNGDTKPPYSLPDMKTISTLKSNSTTGGGGFNEFRFEDKKGEEQVFMHAEKNLDIRVKNDRFETVIHDRHLVVDNDKHEHIKNDRHEQVDRDHIEKVLRDRHLHVEGKQAVKIDKSLSVEVIEDVVEVFSANQSTEVAGDHYLTATNIVIEGTENVTVKVGQSYIAIESSGIKIGTTGDIVLEAMGNLEGSGAMGLTMESPANSEFKGTNTTVSGDAMLTLRGGIVKIN